MDEASIRKLLETVASGDTPVDEALQALPRLALRRARLCYA